ncbi:MAG: rhomboid-like protein [Actinomycetota bacterium]
MNSELHTKVASWRHRTQSYIRDAPITFVYIFIIALTTIVLRSVSPRIARAMLRKRSTNLVEIEHHPIHALVSSAFWISGPQNVREFFFWAVLYAIIVARAEQWLGKLRTILVFFVSHVSATLFVVAGAAFAISHGYAHPRLSRIIDVGVSYGFAGVAAVFTYRLSKRLRVWYAAALVSIFVLGLVFFGGYGDFGHFVALAVGFAAYPITRSAKGRRAHPRGASIRSEHYASSR